MLIFTVGKRVLHRMPSFLSDIEMAAININTKDYDFPFENLVFEGGGNKGLAYCGAIQVNL
jgi:hypothetical protein